MGLLVLIAVVFLCSPAFARTDPDSSNSDEGVTKDKAMVPVHGFLSTRYRWRATEEWSDQDIYQYVGIDVGDPLSYKVTAHLFGRGTADIDGNIDNQGNYVFDSITDTYEDNLNGRLYYAYVDFHRVEGMDKIRVGRQTLRESPVPVYFDGALLETKGIKEFYNFKIGIYGGLPAHLYEDSPEGDSLYGAFVQSKPWPGGRVTLHWTHIDDDYTLGPQHEDIYAAGLWQAVTNYLNVHAMYTWLGTDPREVTGSATFYDPENDLMIRGSYLELLETEREHTLEIDTFFSPAREFYPYRQYRLLGSKGVGEHVVLEGGFDIRSLKDEGKVGNYNHEFLRYFGTVYLIDFPIDGLEISGTGEVWDSENQVEQIESYGAEVGYEIAERLKGRLGTYYSLYKYDYYLAEERDMVQTYYAGLRYSPAEGFGFHVNYEYEDGDYEDINFRDDKFEDYQTLNVELKYRF